MVGTRVNGLVDLFFSWLLWKIDGLVWGVVLVDMKGVGYLVRVGSLMRGFNA